MPNRSGYRASRSVRSGPSRGRVKDLVGPADGRFSLSRLGPPNKRFATGQAFCDGTKRIRRACG
jgi:hypothetical protein